MSVPDSSTAQNHSEDSPPVKRFRGTKQPRAATGTVANNGAGDNSTSFPANGNNSSAMEVDGQASNGVANGDAGQPRPPSYDQQLFSRQIYALGEQAMSRLREAKILISGMGGLGVEIAKNLILGGVRHVTIHDTKTASHIDLSSQYYLTEKDVGKNRAQSCYDKLAELNDCVNVSLSVESLTEAIVKQFDLVILTDSILSDQLRINQHMRQHNKMFMVAETHGLFGMIFNDFGAKFRVEDTTGEQPVEVMIEHVDKVTGEVATLEEARHNLEDGDYVTFREVKGMVELNDSEPRKVKVIGPTKVNIGDISKLSSYSDGGRMRQVKMPKFLEFHSMVESLRKPEFVITDFAKMERPEQLHLAWQAIHKFAEAHSRLPLPHFEDDAKAVLELSHQINTHAGTPHKELDTKLIKEFAYQAQGNLCPMNGFIGGVAAQEAMKAVTGIFHPIYQWLYFDALECLPGDNSPYKVNGDLCRAKNSRYDGQLSVLGQEVQDALAKQNWFIVGSGAIGCELLKNFAMMGVGCSKNGKIIVTDMDAIEVSNLNRQFLFRRSDVTHKKSEVAARAAKHFNSSINIDWLDMRVGPDTEETFDDTFFSKLNGVANALDNVEARTYMDRRCVYYQLPLLESGTLGPKGNTQVVYPHLTESYSSSQDPPEKSIPICTLKNFPNAIEHTIQWARDMFEGLFTNPAELANQYLDDVRGFNERLEKLHTGQKIEMLAAVKAAMIDDRPASAEACIDWARLQFEDHFTNQIKQLLYNFPPDQMNSHGAKFWSGPKRCPHPLQFDSNNPLHLDFVWSASILRAQMYGLKPIEDKHMVAKIATNTKVQEFVPKQGLKIAVTDQEAEAMNEGGGETDADENQIQQLHIALAKLANNKSQRMHPIDFEKDDDANKHMDFIVSTSNLRADNYEIEKADKMKTKQIAGRIIPAIATTTAAVAGLVCLELYKIIVGNGKCRMEDFKNGFLNLALPFFGFSEPIGAPKKKYADTEWTLWDRFDIQGDITLQELMDTFKDKHGLEITMVSQGVSMLYSFFMAPTKQSDRRKMKITKLVETVTGRPIPQYVRALVIEVMCNKIGSDDEDVEIPYIRYILPK